jgi:hypothetical protein
MTETGSHQLFREVLPLRNSPKSSFGTSVWRVGEFRTRHHAVVATAVVTKMARVDDGNIR